MHNYYNLNLKNYKTLKTNLTFVKQKQSYIMKKENKRKLLFEKVKTFSIFFLFFFEQVVSLSRT